MSFATRARPTLYRVVILFLTIALVAAVIGRFGSGAFAKPHYTVPQDGKLESTLGVRFTQAAVVGDGGLVEIRYTVLDAQRASAFQNDVQHPPVIKNERTGKSAWRTALMKQGHQLRPGQTYYVLYLNNQNAIHTGDQITIATPSRTLSHVPVR
jgi:hypothetical protein